MTFPSIDMRGTGSNITKLRQAAGYSVRDLQDMFGFSTPQAIYKWQHGDALPTVDNLLALSGILGVAIEDILAVENDGGDFSFLIKALPRGLYYGFNDKAHGMT